MEYKMKTSPSEPLSDVLRGPLQLGSVEPVKRGIYIQNTGENIPYQELSPVSRARLDAMYQIWLDYLIGEMGKIDPEGVSRGATFAEMTVKDDSEKTTE
jgi:hypothetical protein